MTISFNGVLAQAIDSQSIKSSNDALDSAFTNIMAAQQAGANITTLLAQLNIATNLVAQTENNYKSGNSENDNSTLTIANQIIEQVNKDAIALKASAMTEIDQTFLSNALFSSVGIAVLLVVLILIWQHVKRSYFKNHVEPRSEGAEDQNRKP